MPKRVMIELDGPPFGPPICRDTPPSPSAGNTGSTGGVGGVGASGTACPEFAVNRMITMADISTRPMATDQRVAVHLRWERAS